MNVPAASPKNTSQSSPSPSAPSPQHVLQQLQQHHNEPFTSAAASAAAAVSPLSAPVIDLNNNETFDFGEEELRLALLEAEEIRRTIKTSATFSREHIERKEETNQIKYTPAEMKERLLIELRRQEDLFNHAIELSEIEKNYTIQSANEIVKTVMKDAEEALKEQQRQQDSVLQQQAYELALASAMASAEAALEKEASKHNKTVEELKFQLQQQGLYHEYIQYFMQAAQAAENLELASKALENQMNMNSRSFPPQAVAGSGNDLSAMEMDESLNSINLQSSSSNSYELDDSFANHGNEVFNSIELILKSLEDSPEPIKTSIENALNFKAFLSELVSDHVLVLKARLKAINIKKTQKLEMLQANKELLKTHKYKSDPFLSKSMRTTIKRTLMETENEYQAQRFELEKLRWSMTSDCCSGWFVLFILFDCLFAFNLYYYTLLRYLYYYYYYYYY